MRKRDSVGLISILLATFGFSIAAIWSAYHFGFGSHSDVEYTYVADTKNTSQAVVNSTPNPTPTQDPTPKPSPKKLKTADDIAENSLQAQVKFMPDSNRITSQGVESLDRLEKQAVKFEPESVGIRIYSNSGKSQLSQEIARQRGEEAAGYLRYLGLKHKIVISKRSANIANQKSHSLVVKLYKL